MHDVTGHDMIPESEERERVGRKGGHFQRLDAMMMMMMMMMPPPLLSRSSLFPLLGWRRPRREIYLTMWREKAEGKGERGAGVLHSLPDGLFR